MGRNLVDPNFKEMSDDELINIKYTLSHTAENYNKASYELDRRSNLEDKKRDKIQQSIKKLTILILIFTIILIIIGVLQLFRTG